MAYTKTVWKNDSTPAINETNLNKIEQGIYDAHEEINNITGKILWNNNNPTTNFSSQTITLTSSDYDMLEIIYIDYRANQRFQSIRVPKRKNANLTTLFITGSQIYMATREMTYISDTSLSFNDCKSVTNASITTLNSSSPAQCIPFCIIGYKTNLFD